MKRTVALLSLCLTACCGSSSEPPPQQQRVHHEGIVDISPNELKELLSTPSSKPRVVNFWATWCGPCVVELPVLAKLAQDRPDIDVTLLNVDFPKMKNTTVKSFVQKRGLTGLDIRNLNDPDPAFTLARIVPRWPQTIPVTLILGTDGQIVREFHGEVTRQQLDETLKGLVENR